MSPVAQSLLSEHDVPAGVVVVEQADTASATIRAAPVSHATIRHVPTLATLAVILFIVRVP
jgi:hypothetical protein